MYYLSVSDVWSLHVRRCFRGQNCVRESAYGLPISARSAVLSVRRASETPRLGLSCLLTSLTPARTVFEPRATSKAPTSRTQKRACRSRRSDTAGRCRCVPGPARPAFALRQQSPSPIAEMGHCSARRSSCRPTSISTLQTSCSRASARLSLLQ